MTFLPDTLIPPERHGEAFDQRSAQPLQFLRPIQQVEEDTDRGDPDPAVEGFPSLEPLQSPALTVVAGDAVPLLYHAASRLGRHRDTSAL